VHQGTVNEADSCFFTMQIKKVDFILNTKLICQKNKLINQTDLTAIN